jgi:hypothetical protein
VLPRGSFRGVAGDPPLTRSSTLKKGKTFYPTHRSVSESLRPLFEKDYVAPGDLKVPSKMQDAEEAGRAPFLILFDSKLAYSSH